MKGERHEVQILGWPGLPDLVGGQAVREQFVCLEITDRSGGFTVDTGGPGRSRFRRFVVD